MATEIERLVVRLMGDNASYLSTIRASTQAARGFQRVQRRIGQAADTASNALTRYQGTSQTTAQAGRVHTAIQNNFNNSLRSSVTIINNVTRTMKGKNRALDDQTSKTNKDTNAINRMVNALRRLRRAVRLMAAPFRDFSRALDRTGKQLAIVGRRMSTFVTLPILGMGVAVAKTFTDFDLAMTESMSIMGNLTDQTKESMKTMALELSKNGKFAADELAKGYFFLASAGFTAQQAIEALPAVTNFATAGAFDLAKATSLAADAQKALGLESQNATTNLGNMKRVMDVLTKANQLSNANIEQFSEALTNRAAASMRLFNVSVEEGTAVLATFAEQNVKAHKAGTFFDRALRLLAKSAIDAREAHERMGFTVFDKNTGQMRNFADIIQDLETILAGMSDEMQAATLAELGFAARIQQTITPLIGQSKKIRDFTTQLKAAGGATEEVANKQMEALANRFKMIKNRVAALAIEIGDRLTPVLEGLISFVQFLIDQWNALSPTVQRNIAVVTALTAVIGPLILSLGLMAGSLGAILSVIGAILSPWMMFVAGITSAVALVVKFTVGWENALEAVKNFARNALGFLVNFRENFQIIITWLARNWGNLMEDFWQLVQLSFEFIITKVIPAAMVLFIKNFWAGLKAIPRLFKLIITSAMTQFILFGKFIADTVRAAFTGQALPSVKEFTKKLGKHLLIDLKESKIIDSVKEIAGNVEEAFDKLGDPLEKFKSNVEEGPKLNFALPELPKIVRKDLDKAAKAAKDAAPNVTKQLKRGLKENKVDMREAVGADSLEALKRVMEFRRGAGIPQNIEELRKPKPKNQEALQKEANKALFQILRSLGVLVELERQDQRNKNVGDTDLFDLENANLAANIG